MRRACERCRTPREMEGSHRHTEQAEERHRGSMVVRRMVDFGAHVPPAKGVAGRRWRRLAALCEYV